MRLLFIDGWNSFWHFVFGCLSVFFWQIIPIFSAYQLLDPFEKNILVDFSEFFLGYNLTICIVFYHVFRYYNNYIDLTIRSLHNNSTHN